MHEHYSRNLELNLGIREHDILLDRLEGVKVAISGWYRTLAEVDPNNMPEHIERETYWEYWMDDFKVLVDDVYEQNQHCLKLAISGPATGRILSKNGQGDKHEQFAILEATDIEKGAEFTLDFAERRGVQNASDGERPAPSRYYWIEQLYVGDREKGIAFSLAQLAKMLEENSAGLMLANKD